MFADFALTTTLSVWASVPPEPPGGIHRLSQAEKLAHLERWQSVLAARAKLVAAFRPKSGESDVFICVWTGERLAYPDCRLEQILTDEEIALLEAEEDDPFLELLEEGWNCAIAKVRKGLNL